MEDHQSFFPMGKARLQEGEPEAISRRQMRSLDLALENGQLLAQQGILWNQLSLAEREIRHGAQEQERASGLREMTEGLIQQREEIREELAHMSLPFAGFALDLSLKPTRDA